MHQREVTITELTTGERESLWVQHITEDTGEASLAAAYMPVAAWIAKRLQSIASRDRAEYAPEPSFVVTFTGRSKGATI